MKLPFFRIVLLLVLCVPVLAQQKPTLDYYLPADVRYDQNIPTPASWLGYEVGEWHTSHDQLIGYMRALDAASDRITLQEYGRSHENRPLVCLTITDPSNFARLNDIKSARQQMFNPQGTGKPNLKDIPAVYYMGYSIHGNEASGDHASMLVAYHLAAGQSQELTQLLKNTVILLDPCFNPDGLQRFANWINTNKSKTLSADQVGNEYNEPWPRGRTNHYGFDLNRDWLVARQPESVGRVALFQEWRPNVLTDHHEMGSNSTFFFQPGVPSRVNPITPARNQELTAKIATYHAKLLSEKKILFYTGENFDDFYYGKGSTYPDAQGCIGILFEQASSRGTAQETDNGLLTFPFTIRNQVYASLSSLQAVGDMRVELNEYLYSFYQSALEDASKAEVKGYLFTNEDAASAAFLDILGMHKIRSSRLTQDYSAGGKTFRADNTVFVPCQQPQYRLIRGIFERQTTFSDSIFYDISAWTLPDAFGLEWQPVTGKEIASIKTQEKNLNESRKPALPPGDIIPFAFAVSPEGYDFPRIAARILRSGVRVRVAMEPFTADGHSFRQGTLVLAADRQNISAREFSSLMNEVTELGATVTAIENGLTPAGPDLGSSQFPVARQPKILLLTGDGVSVSESGEAWHLLDTRYQIPATLVDVDRFNGLNLSRYNVLIIPDGNYSKLSADKIRQFAQDGGTVIATGNALRWLKSAGIANIEFRNSTGDQPASRPYASLTEDKGALTLAGAIFEAELDLTHPLCFGYTRNRLPVFFGDTLFVSPGKNPYSTPARLTHKPLLAGYVHNSQIPMTGGAAAVSVHGAGKGKIIAFPTSPNFRSFWYGTNRLFANAILFGNLISGDSTEKK
ncbi:MAG: M14 family metallopeptidase [Bacteroidota bacterium]|jgi:hypothetical protein